MTGMDLLYSLGKVDDQLLLECESEVRRRKSLPFKVVLIAAASVFSWLRTMLINFNKRMRRRKKTHLKGSMW